MTRPGAKISFALSCLAALLLAATVAQAEVPALMSYQGRLQDSVGAPLDGTFDIAFAIYDVASDGTALWTETQSVVVNEGLFIVLLGAVQPIPADLFGAQARYLGVTVGTDPEMSPRRQIVTAAYASHAQTADIAVGIQDGAVVNADISATANIDPTKIAGTALTLGGANNFSGTATFLDSAMVVSGNQVVMGRNTPPAANDVLGLKRSLASAASSSGAHIDLANSGTGQLYGLASTADATGDLAVGVFGNGMADGDSAFGVYGTASAAAANIGVYGTASGAIGGKIGVEGEVSNGFNITGVKGLVRGGSGTPYGVFGHATGSFDGYGVRGFADQNQSSGRGVDGIAFGNLGSGFGVYGRANDNTGAGYGIYGAAGTNGVTDWAGYFSGNVNVTGTIFTPVMITQIDHPLNPENQTLQFAGVTSPQMSNVLFGNVTTDGNGDAVVALPEYFTAISTDYKYQLTVVGQFAQAIISSEVESSQFSIKTDKPNIKVSWQIIALRDDPYARANRLEVEKAKRPESVGLYLHPAAYGLGPERGVDWTNDNGMLIRTSKQ
ncbi:MAG: hypothetical protein WBP29_04240 [Candidatus Zixiibacteriota bacterium]